MFNFTRKNNKTDKIWDLVNTKENSNDYSSNRNVRVNQEEVNVLNELNPPETEGLNLKIKKINDVVYKETQILITDLNGFINYVNDKCCAALGYEHWELIGQHTRIFKTGLHSEEFYQNLWETLLMGDIWEGEIAAKRKDGTVVWYFMSIFPITDQSNKPFCFLTIRKDITEEKEKEKQVLLQEKLLAAPPDEVVGIVDQYGNFKYVSYAIKKVFGYSPSELIGKNGYDYVREESHPQLKLWFKKLKSNFESPDTLEIEFRSKSGSWVSCAMTAKNMLHDPDINGIVFIHREITEQKLLYEKMEYCDMLTGLPNYKQLDVCLSKEIDIAKENNALIAVVYLDLDDFKYVNNMFGRQNANQLLIDFSSKINDELKSEVCMFRPGGDEFILVVKGLDDYEEVVQVLSKLHSKINNEPYNIKGEEVHLSASMGVSIFPYSGETKDKLLKNAEVAMYRAKKSGKNQFLIFSPTMSLYNFKQFTLRNDSKKALINNEYIIDFQPRFDPTTNQIVSAEALIRWSHPKWGIVSPTEFISMAEDSGLIVQIGEWMIKRICNQIKEWQSEGLAVKKISINLSALQLLQPNFVDMVLSSLTESAVHPKWIEFEITETVIIQKEEQVLKTLNELRSSGITIALDDFGTGYSSLNYLSKFPCQVIKIDKSLIDNIHKDPDSFEITSSIIHLCHKLKKTVVAEGVETNEQLSLLKQLNCDEIQGYLYSKPISEHKFREYFRNNTWEKINDVNSREKINQRKYFRIKFKTHLLAANMTIDKVGNKKLNLGSSQVFIENIGPGGLCFFSSLHLPVKEEIQLLFLTEIAFKELKVIGHIVWSKEQNNGLYKYGVEFQVKKREQEELIKLLNSIGVKLKKNPILPGSSFVTVKDL
ncbi:EAL domain-containing protein [Neobacillus sp. PS3-12]|uniref:EAL domain-containing protein n=1 Tax=Neobacillus sp. PS3-12 TaxID=3070677 RepID=UPI0027E094EA|nr:EAL domain-containing protein [Neobacillus sp. PS3-12]WML55156.1 EAL domain-containing protein [Neobacillus sp. PS3-12]